MYSDQAGTFNQSSINLGTGYSNSNVIASVYVKNLGIVNEVLSVQTKNLIPSKASAYLTLTSNSTGQVLAPRQV